MANLNFKSGGKEIEIEWTASKKVTSEATL